MDEKKDVNEIPGGMTEDSGNDSDSGNFGNISDFIGDSDSGETEEAFDIDGKKDKKSKKEDKKEHRENAELKKLLAEALKKADETEDKYLRIMAEYDNFRRRSSKELEGRYSDAYADALVQILPIIDTIEIAATYKESDKVSEGIAMMVKSFPETLAKLGVEAFGAEGDIFDPNLHSAVMRVEDENRKEGEIISVLQKGYKRGEKVIRYAMVTVAG